MTTAADWRDRAACRDTSPEMFFTADPEELQAAAKTCANCDVREECLEFGLREQDGLWGGLTARERGRVRLSRGITLRSRAATLQEVGFPPHQQHRPSTRKRAPGEMTGPEIAQALRDAGYDGIVSVLKPKLIQIYEEYRSQRVSS